MLWRPVSSERQSEARAAQGHCSRPDKPWTGQPGPGHTQLLRQEASLAGLSLTF